MAHWFDELLDQVRAALPEGTDVVVNGGLSVSGLQHVGRLRGEIVLAHVLARSLREAGRPATQHLVQYTQDQWKGTAWQQAQFPDDEAAQYVGWRLIEVPDPHGCHGSWVDHYWAEFADRLGTYAPGIAVTSTTELYRRRDMKALVADLADRAEEVRAVVNRYRPRHPYPEGWIPFEAYCTSCRRVGSARTIRIVGTEAVEYECECGNRGSSSIELGKLNWRLEWPAVWKVLRVSVEPFGKDHAAPGGSRDSCKEIARDVMGFEPPFGIPYEWVGYGERGVDKGDMGSSDAIGFGPSAWEEVGDVEVLRHVFLAAPPMRRIVLDLTRADAYHDAFDAGEAARYGRTEPSEAHARTYDLAILQPPPVEPPFALPFRHAAYLSQIAPPQSRVDWVLRRLADTGILTREATAFERERIARRLRQARAWVDRYSPESRIVLLERLTDAVRALLSDADRRALSLWAAKAEGIDWREDAIKESMVALTSGGELPVGTNEFFRALYLILLGTERGPRAAPFLAVMDKSFVLDRVREAAET